MKSFTKQKIVYGVLAVAILVSGFAISKMLIATAPKAQKNERPNVAVLVDTARFERSSNVVIIKSYGKIRAKNIAKVAAEVSGKVIYISNSLRPSNSVKKGEILLKIDPLNYQSVLQQKEAALQKAYADMDMELGLAEVAKREFLMLDGMLPDTNNTALVLREPQLKKAKAAILSAEAELLKARADLERCTIKAPFDGYIEEKFISLGESVSSSTPLFSIVGNDGFWIEADIRESELKMVDFGVSEADIYISGYEAPLKGVVKGMLPSVDSSTQKVRVLIELNGRQIVDIPIFSGMFVRVDIRGVSIANSVLLPLKLIRDNGVVWLYEDGKLKFKKLNIIFRGDDFVLTDSIDGSDEVVVTNLNSPAEGINLKVKGSSR